MDRSMKDISSGIRKFENGLLNREIEPVKVLFSQVKVSRVRGGWMSFST